ncbi:major capsid protein [Dipodfec virus UOA04_Rod_819]|nr:major capsid protein [Dipodfec virus UOA04_Rod_819]
MVNTVAPVSRSEVFSRVPQSEAVQYSTFDRSYRHLTAFDASYMIPIHVDEVIPGDIFKVDGRHLNRLLTPIKPFMDVLKARFFFYYVRNRLIDDNWERIMGARKYPDEKPDDVYQVPMLNSGSKGIEVGTIFDYAGVPTGVPNLEFSAYPFRAMNLCFNEFHRDQNLVDWLPIGGTLKSGSTSEFDWSSQFGAVDRLENYSLFKIAKAHDYFTSALPFQQYGTASSISIGTTAPVIGNGITIGLTNGVVNVGLTGNEHNSNANLFNTPNYGKPIGTPETQTFIGTRSTWGLTTEPANSGMIADLSQVTGFTISDFRTMFQLQALKELTARMGHRYKEVIYGEFNVIVGDATLDRPEYLGGYTVYFNTIPVASTAETTDNPQGNLAAFSYTDNSEHHCFTKAFDEHGWIIGFCVVTTDQTYQQGLNKMYSRKTKYDFYTPLLADISEQAIKMKELFAQGTKVLSEDGETPVDDITFGFQEAWAEYRYKPSMITGRMRTTATQNLGIWHLGTEFGATVVDGKNIGVPLNEDFINDNTIENLKRVLAVTTTEENGETPQIESDNWFHMVCTRSMPIYSVPAYLRGRL